MGHRLTNIKSRNLLHCGQIELKTIRLIYFRIFFNVTQENILKKNIKLMYRLKNTHKNKKKIVSILTTQNIFVKKIRG